MMAVRCSVKSAPKSPKIWPFFNKNGSFRGFGRGIQWLGEPRLPQFIYLRYNEHMFEHIIYKESKLANGLKVMTAQNDSILVVDTSLWTRTGYRYEKSDEFGYAHLLEHMLFSGTKKGQQNTT